MAPFATQVRQLIPESLAAGAGQRKAEPTALELETYYKLAVRHYLLHSQRKLCSRVRLGASKEAAFYR
ncbi:hypothetical protein A4244_18310 [Bacillus badius]|nr:hypothetical protein A4244_18310 [Bacillus badius]OCS85337.1 hypothetical protein A6M11_18325 [Bacillus badius]OVE50388.1 hypothetical protein B1A98_15870 [Bacillus badius]